MAGPVNSGVRPHEMSTQINRRKLWLLLTAVWCSCVLAFFFSHLARDYKKSIQFFQTASSSRIESDWQECADKQSPNAWLKFGSECRAVGQDRCNSSDLLWYDGCVEMEQKFCVHSRVPQCNDIFINAQKIYFATPAWKRKLERVKNFIDYSDAFWLALLLIVSGPLCFWLLPKALRKLRGWLYA